ncbi:MAG: nucleoid-associated protein [Anaerolineaceae bacterium]|nr:nucleoid-associated protein [Anaerolineaceae bacterium]
MPDIVLQRMIVHSVDHLDKVEEHFISQLSELESPITPEVNDFVVGHIRAGREHRYTRSAYFTPTPPGSISLDARVTSFLNDPANFVEESREIALALYKASGGKIAKSITPGDLVVATFLDSEDPQALWAALLKMEHTDGFVGHHTEQNGKRLTLLERVSDVLPSGDLQKCAFILPLSKRQDHLHLKVLDQQAGRYGITRPVATFFLTNFLQCAVADHPADQAGIFIYASQEWVDKKKDIWSEADISHFIQQAAASLENPSVDVVGFANALIPISDEQVEYVTFMRQKGLTNLVFTPDPAVREKLTHFVWFEGDADLRLRILSDAVGQGKTLEADKNSNTGLWTVKIKTQSWVQKTHGRV